MAKNLKGKQTDSKQYILTWIFVLLLNGMERYGDATRETSFWMLGAVQQKRQQENSPYPRASLLMKLFGFERFIT
jgi:hypothetical protein